MRKNLLVAVLLLLPSITWGAEAPNFIPLVGIPYIEGDEVQSFGDYVNAFYFAAISIAAFLAVVKIIFAGVKYMLSDIVTTKQDAKKDIRTALFGLLIVVGAVLILNTINTNLTNISLFADAPVPRIGLEDDRVGEDRVQLGDRINTCETSSAEQDVFTEGCTDPNTGGAIRRRNVSPACQEIACDMASNGDRDDAILDDELSEEAGDREVLSEYGLEDIPESVRRTQERWAWIEENWAAPCEEDAATGEETGNEWVEIETNTTNNIRYACVGP